MEKLYQFRQGIGMDPLDQLPLPSSVLHLNVLHLLPASPTFRDEVVFRCGLINLFEFLLVWGDEGSGFPGGAERFKTTDGGLYGEFLTIGTFGRMGKRTYSQVRCKKRL